MDNKLNHFSWLCNHCNRGSTVCSNEAAKAYAVQNGTTFELTSLWMRKKSVCIVVVYLSITDQRLLTVGDAVTSFMHIPDATLHWLVSHSVFLVSIETYDVNDLPKEEGDREATCIYSLLPISILFMSGLVVVFALVQGGKVSRTQGMPLVRSNSAGIAAACHPLKRNDDLQKPSMRSVVSQDTGTEKRIEHCSFSSSAVERPVEGQLYS